jgi:hypothetical protein
MRYSDTVSIYPYVTQNIGHTRTYSSTPNVVKANVDNLTKLVRYPEIEKVPDARIALPPDTIIKNEDRVVLSNGVTGVVVSINYCMNYRTKKVQYLEVNLNKDQKGEPSRW